MDNIFTLGATFLAIGLIVIGLSYSVLKLEKSELISIRKSAYGLLLPLPISTVMRYEIIEVGTLLNGFINMIFIGSLAVSVYSLIKLTTAAFIYLRRYLP